MSDEGRERGDAIGGEGGGGQENPPPPPPSRIARTESPLRFFLLESLVVVFSVLAALGVDQWREERAQRALAREAMADVVEEVRANLRELEYTESVTRDRLERLRGLAPEIDTDRPYFEQLGSFPGYYTADLGVSAWERATTGTAGAHIPSDFYSDAFPVYRGTELLMSLEGRIQNLVFGPLVYEPSSAPVALRIADAILEQQIGWIDAYRGGFEAFLDEWGGLASRAADPD